MMLSRATIRHRCIAAIAGSHRHLYPLAATCIAFAASIFFAQSAGGDGVVAHPRMGAAATTEGWR